MDTEIKIQNIKRDLFFKKLIFCEKYLHSCAFLKQKTRFTPPFVK